MFNKQRGFAVIEVSLIIVALCIIAFVAWRVIDAQGSVDEAATTDSSVNVNPGSVPAVNNVDDLTKLEKQVDETPLDDSAATELDAASDF